MALTLALPLSGVEPEYFYAIGGRLMYKEGLRMLAGGGPISPSTESVSSGFGSITVSLECSPDSSRSNTPVKEISEEIPAESNLRVFHEERDILNLGANIREPYWQMQRSKMPCYDHKFLTIDWNLCRRFSDRVHDEKYLTKNCKDCDFCVPWPYIY